MSWHRFHGRALADRSLTGEARDTELESYIRYTNSHLCDVRLESAADTEDFDASRRWFEVTYLADDGCGA